MSAPHDHVDDDVLNRKWYIIEAEKGLVISRSAEFGTHLLFWSERTAAEEMCREYSNATPHRVSEISPSELHEQLIACREAGMKVVVRDRRSDGSARIIPIDEAIEVYGNIASLRTDLSRSSGDELIRLLDGKRATGVAVSTEDQYIPIDCPRCGELFSVHEIAYRKWRDNELEKMLCPNCLASFRKANFTRATCRNCGAESGKMPPSLKRHFESSNRGWRCGKCVGAELHAALAASSPERCRPGASFAIVPPTTRTQRLSDRTPLTYAELIAIPGQSPTLQETLEMCLALDVRHEDLLKPACQTRIAEEWVGRKRTRVYEEGFRRIGIDLPESCIATISSVLSLATTRVVVLSEEERRAAIALMKHAYTADGSTEATAEQNAERWVKECEAASRRKHEFNARTGCAAIVLFVILTPAFLCALLGSSVTP